VLDRKDAESFFGREDGSECFTYTLRNNDLASIKTMYAPILSHEGRFVTIQIKLEDSPTIVAAAKSLLKTTRLRFMSLGFRAIQALRQSRRVLKERFSQFRSINNVSVLC